MPPTGKTLASTQQTMSASDVRRRVFVVCGTDDEMKQAVTDALIKLRLVPVVMCEEPSQGRKIVRNLSKDYADVGFAVVLLSPDDFAYPTNEATTKRKLRPRQDVVFEFGFLLGKLGKSNVLVFFRECANFEIPLDFEGMTVIAFDDRDSWKLALIRELCSSGLAVEVTDY